MAALRADDSAPAMGLSWRLALAASIFLSVAGHAHQAFDLLSVQWIGLAGFCAIVWLFALTNRLGVVVHPGDVAVALFLVYAAASLAWTPVPLVGLPFLVKATCVWLVVVGARPLFANGVPKIVPAAIAAGVLQSLLLSHFPPNLQTFGGFANPNYYIEFLLMATPWMVGLAVAWGVSFNGGVLALLLGATAWELLIRSPSKIPVLVAVGLAVAALPFVAFRMGGWWRLAPVVAVALAAAGAYLRGFDSFARSLGERGEIFWNSLAIGIDRFPFGGGVGAFGILYPLFQERHLSVFPTSYLIQRRVMVGSAHNDTLQIFADFGLIGILLLLSGVWLIWRNRPVASDGTGHWPVVAGVSLAAGAIASLVGFTFQNPAALALLALGLAALTSRGMTGRAPAASVLPYNVVFAAFAVGLSGLILSASICNFAAYRAVRHMAVLRQPAPDSAYDAHALAQRLAPWDAYIGQTLFITYMGWSVAVDQRYANLPGDRVGRLREPSESGSDNRRAFEFSRGYAPYNFNLSFGRIQYLLNDRQHVRHRAELDALFAAARAAVPQLPEFAILDAYDAVLMRDSARLAAILQRVRSSKLPWPAEKRAAVEVLAAEESKIRSAGAAYRYFGLVYLDW